MSKQPFKNKTIGLCVQAAMIALCFLLDVLSTYLSTATGGTMKIPLNSLPTIVAAILFGPVSGMVVGAVSELLTQLVTYGLTPTTIFWILPAAVRGLSVGLLYRAFGRRETFWPLCANTVLSSLLVTACNTVVIYLDSVIYGYYSPAVVFGALSIRIVVSTVTTVVFAVLLVPLLKSIRKTV
ncbi:MAG: folate family ECF transporter S component [Clostridia bacterium]|nr:folate family ECF transporter S component [Clostridia bacterium]